MHMRIYTNGQHCIGRFKGGKRAHLGEKGGYTPPKCDFCSMVLADYTGIWDITNEVLACNSSKTFN